MRHYELVVVLSPMISPDEAGQAWERIKGFITTREAEIVHEERWGTRRLAYPVKKGQYQFLEGNYHLTRFTTDATFNRDLENYLKLDDNVLRSLVTLTLSEEELAAHAAQTRAPRPPRPPAGAPPAGAPPAAGQAAAAPASAEEATAPPASAEEATAPAGETPAGEAPISDATAPPAVKIPSAEAPVESPAPDAVAAPPDNPQPEEPSE